MFRINDQWTGSSPLGTIRKSRVPRKDEQLPHRHLLRETKRTLKQKELEGEEIENIRRTLNWTPMKYWNMGAYSFVDSFWIRGDEHLISGGWSDKMEYVFWMLSLHRHCGEQLDYSKRNSERWMERCQKRHSSKKRTKYF